MAFNKKMAMTVGGLAAGGVGVVLLDNAIQSTDYAKTNPDQAYYAKLGGGAASVALGIYAITRPSATAKLIGGLLLAGGGVIAGKGYLDHDAYVKATAPPSITFTPGSAGGAPVTLSAPSGGLPATGGVPVLLAGPGGTTSGLSAGVSPMPQLLAQSGAAMRLGMGQAGAAMRLGMSQAGAAMRLGMARR